jgi:hypothetical protein
MLEFDDESRKDFKDLKEGIDKGFNDEKVI